MSSIRDIAKKSGVSVATVSHVLNKTRYVSPELTKKVKDIMTELDYKPNMVAGSLRSKKTKTIGLILPDSANKVFSQIGQIVEVECAKAEYNVIFCNSSYDVETELKNIDILRMKMVDGIIIIPSTKDTNCILKLMKSEIPFVVVNTRVANFAIDQVYVDNELLAFIATEHLIALGHKKLIYLDRMVDHDYSMQRKKGFLHSLIKNNIENEPELYIRSNGFSYMNGYNVMKKFLEKGIPFDAVFAYNDVHAIGAMRAILDAGLNVPKDVSIIGCDNIPAAEFMNPRLTTMDYPVHDLGKESALILMGKLQNPAIESRQIVLKPILVQRESSGNKY
jgi:DNA-binding LacI/PurR family transcriptional regulator